MSNGKVNITIGKWMYVLRQDPTSGELEVVESRQVGLVQKAAEYVKAEASRVVGSVSLPQLASRREACVSCESAKVVDEQTWYCKACGCPEWDRSRLQVKWEMPAATCPLGKWQE